MGRGCSALLGALALHSACVMLQPPVTGALWGWFMTVNGSNGFTCQQGTTIGCASTANCTDSNFTCSVVAATGYSCTPQSVSLQCSKNGVPPFQPASGGACINIGGVWNGTTIPKDSSMLMWSATPTCSKTALSTSKGHKVGAGVGVSLASVAAGALVFVLPRLRSA